MKQRDILLILIPTLLLVVLWVVFNIYHNSVSSTVSKSLAEKVIPIDPNFDLQTIENLKKRSAIEPLYELPPTNSSLSINAGAQATPSASENKEKITIPTETPNEIEPVPSPEVTSP